MLFYTDNLIPTLVFAKVSTDRKAMWAAILEKAWAKVRGNYVNAGKGGFTMNSLHMLTGYPVFWYSN